MRERDEPLRIWIVVVTLVFASAWALVGGREAHVARRRAAETTPFLAQVPSESSCSVRRGLDVAATTWIADAAVRAAGWQAPPHLPTLPQDRMPVDYVSTSRGVLILVQASSHEQPDGYPYWLALLAPGDVDAQHVPATRVARDVVALSPFVGEIDDALFLASEAGGGTLSTLDPISLVTLRTRTGLAPRPGGTSGLSYFTPDGKGGLFFVSYGDTGARVHHVSENLDDVIPARFFTVPAGPTEHWNPHAFGVTADRMCVELDCFDPMRKNTSVGSQGCGSRFLVLDHAFEPVVVAPANPGPDAVRTLVTWLGLAGVLGWMVAIVILVRTERARRELAGATTDAEVLAVTLDAIRIQTQAGVFTVPHTRLNPYFGALHPGACVIDAGEAVAPVGYREGPELVPPGRKLTIAMGEQAQIIARARRLVWITWAFACATEVALVASAVVARV